LEAEEVQLQEEKEALLQDVKVLVADLEAEVQHQEKVVLDKKLHQLQEEKVVLHQTDQEQKVHLIAPRRSKTLVTHQDQEDQEETNV
jgi:hypothetical protein